MSDDDPVERFVDDTFDGGDDTGTDVPIPEPRDMEAELHERRDGNGADAEDLSADSEVASAFWAAVVYVNVGVLLIALGPTVYALRGMPLVSVALPVGGAYALYRAYAVYRKFEADRTDAGGTTEAADPGESDDGAD